jgi:hypothetical protein
MHRQQLAHVIPVERDEIGDLLAVGLESLSRCPVSISKLIFATVTGTPGERTAVARVILGVLPFVGATLSFPPIQ